MELIQALKVARKNCYSRQAWEYDSLKCAAESAVERVLDDLIDALEAGDGDA